MARIVSIFILICMMVIAVSVGVVAHLQVGLSLGEAVILSLMVMMVTFAVHIEQNRRRDNARLIARFEELSGQVDGLGDDVTNLENRLTAVESRALEQAGEHIEGIYEEVEVFGVLIKQLAEALADLEVRVAEIEDRDAPAAEPARAAIAPPAIDAPARAAPPQPEPVQTPQEAKASVAAPTARRTIDAATRAAYEETLRAVQSAILGNRIELHLQPIVTLPQRRTRFYEALIRLRDENEVMLYPDEFLEATEVARVTPRIDQIMLRRALSVAKRFSGNDRGLGLFCNLSSLSLVDARCFGELLEQLRAQDGLGAFLMLEFTQASYRAMGPLEFEALEELRELGVRVSLDNVADMRMDFSELGRHGVRFLKIDAARLLNPAMMTGTDIHLADLSDLLARFGIELIVDRIETESQVLELLDYGPRFGQGNLFAPPKAVRAEVLSTVAASEPQRRATV